MGLVRDDNVNAVAIMDEVEGQIELDRLADVLKLRFSTMYVICVLSNITMVLCGFPLSVITCVPIHVLSKGI